MLRGLRVIQPTRARHLPSQIPGRGPTRCKWFKAADGRTLVGDDSRGGWSRGGGAHVMQQVCELSEFSLPTRDVAMVFAVAICAQSWHLFDAQTNLSNVCLLVHQAAVYD